MKRERWFHAIGRREGGTHLPWVVGTLCGVASITILQLRHFDVFIDLVLFGWAGVVREPWSRELLPCFAALLGTALAGAIALHLTRGGRARRLTKVQQSIRVVSHAGIAILLALLIGFLLWPGVRFKDDWMQMFMDAAGLRPLDNKIAVYLPRSGNGVGAPPEDDVPQIVVCLGANDAGAWRAWVDGESVEPTVAAMRAAVGADMEERAVSAEEVRVRFDVAPDVPFQLVIRALDAVLHHGIRQAWYSGIR